MSRQDAAAGRCIDMLAPIVWAPLPQSTVLGADEVHLWLVDDQAIAEPALLGAYWQLLNSHERASYERFHFAKHRQQYLVTRALVRSVLTLYNAAVRPEQWRFENNAYGKPSIQNSPVPLVFNLSHTENKVVLAVTAGGELGVDVEWTGRRNDTLAIAENYFSSLELSQLRALPAPKQGQRFFQLWTLKEAYIKACGLGLAIPLDEFSFSFDEREFVAVSFAQARGDDPRRWQFWRQQLAPEYQLAVALKRDLKRKPCRVLLRRCVPLRHCMPLSGAEWP